MKVSILRLSTSLVNDWSHWGDWSHGTDWRPYLEGLRFSDRHCSSSTPIGDPHGYQIGDFRSIGASYWDCSCLWHWISRSVGQLSALKSTMDPSLTL